MDKPWGVQLPDALPFEIKLELSLYHVGSNIAFWSSSVKSSGGVEHTGPSSLCSIEEYWKGQTLRGGRVLRRSELRLS